MKADNSCAKAARASAVAKRISTSIAMVDTRFFAAAARAQPCEIADRSGGESHEVSNGKRVPLLGGRGSERPQRRGTHHITARRGLDYPLHAISLAPLLHEGYESRMLQFTDVIAHLLARQPTRRATAAAVSGSASSPIS